MKFTLNWLKKYLDTNASLDEISDKLTAIGLEVEGIEDKAATFAPFKVAYVEAAERHPDADKLQVCTVKTESGTFQVVCGAPNARTGMKGIFAPEGTYIPGLDVTLKKAKIRGVESSGMLVSEKEMCLSDEHNGIIEVDDSHEIGTPMVQIFGLDDPVVEINVTPNRADCTGIYGIARDLAAAGLGTLKPLEETSIKGSFKSPINVKIEDNQGCPQFLGRTIKGVKNGVSPQWLQEYLKSIGLRPISALVDITNYFTIGHARPLHVYDADKIKGDIIVRKTKAGEELEALNDKSYEAIENMVGITDNSGLIGIGGIVGGTSTGSDESTTNVFLEAAYFDPMRIARAGRDMGIITDARYRFERGVDPEFTANAMELATQMILDICGGEASEVVEAGDVPDWSREIEYDPAYVQKLIGVDVSKKKQKAIFENLGFKVSGSNPMSVTPPSWRGDIDGRAALTEEVIRIYGFNHIPVTSIKAEHPLAKVPQTPRLKNSKHARNALTARGLDECVTWSFMNKDLAAHFGSNDNPALTLSNPISEELNQIRPSILGNLIEAAGRNAAQGFANVALCEIGPVFYTSKSEGQAYIAAGIRAGQNADRHWSDANAARDVDVYDVKVDVLAALDACGAPSSNAPISRDAPEYYHPGRSGTVRLGKNVLAYFGEIHPAILDEMGIKTSVSGFEVFLENIPEPRVKKGKSKTAKPYLHLEPLQPVSRDFAFIVDKDVEANNILRAVTSADKKLIVDASIFDIYAGKGIEDGKKSVALSITLQPTEKTLTDKDIETLSNAVINAVEIKVGGVLRG